MNSGRVIRNNGKYTRRLTVMVKKMLEKSTTGRAGGSMERANAVDP
jgi:hypothetical protein